MITNPNRPQRESLGDSPVILVLLGIALIGFGLYLMVAKLHVRPMQLAEAGLYFFIGSCDIFECLIFGGHSKKPASACDVIDVFT